MELLKKDLFKVVNDLKGSYTVYVLHCISHDLKMGAGIAKPMQSKFHIREQAPQLGNWKNEGYAFMTIGEDHLKIVNLVTKQLYWHKPTYNSLKQSLDVAKNIIEKGVKSNEKSNEKSIIVMPKIGCGLDRLNWEIVSGIIEEFEEALKIPCRVCYL